MRYKSLVCTLFEGSYHYGVGALANSLYSNGYRGRLVAGYRGALPDWAVVDANGVMPLGEGMEIEFRLLTTKDHFTNYKADFMLQLFEQPAVDTVFYMDPDIVVTEAWAFFEQWVQAGVAVCEDVNSPIPLGNPRRYGWRQCLEKAGITLVPRYGEYANGGFVALQRCHLGFLVKWQAIQQVVNTEMGGADRVGIGGGVKLTNSDNGFAHCWSTTDQDALNATIEACPEVPISFTQRSMMGFEHGFCGLPHALGPRKPWNVNYLKILLDGRRASRVHEMYWQNVASPVALYSKSKIKWMILFIKLNKFLSRFYGMR